MTTLTEDFLRKRKQIYKKMYIVLIDLEGNARFKNRKTGDIECILKYKSYPDNYYNIHEKKNVSCHNSAFVRLVHEKKIKRMCIPIGHFKKICKTGRCCRSREVLVPKKEDPKLLLYSLKEAFDQIEKYDVWNECKIFSTNGDFLSHEFNQIDYTLNIRSRNLRIKEMFDEGKRFPPKALATLWKLDISKIYKILKDVNPRAQTKTKKKD